MLRGLLRGMLRGYASGYASGPFFAKEYKAKFFGRILGTIVFERGAARLQAHFGSSSRKITTCQYKRSAQKKPWQLQLQNATFQHKRNTQSTRWQPQRAKRTLAAPARKITPLNTSTMCASTEPLRKHDPPDLIVSARLAQMLRTLFSSAAVGAVVRA